MFGIGEEGGGGGEDYDPLVYPQAFVPRMTHLILFVHKFAFHLSEYFGFVSKKNREQREYEE